MSVAIIDYGSGNLHSAAKAFERAARESGHDAADRGRPAIRTGRARPTASCCRASAPSPIAGAGSTRSPAWSRRSTEAVLQRGRPFLGICVGMQLMAERGREYEVTPGLGWIAGDVDRDRARRTRRLKIPHMGWNTLDVRKPHPLLDGIPLGPRRSARLFRAFLSSASRTSAADVVAQADYGGAVTAIVGRDNMVGTQFHPEKSQALGLALIANFLKWAP